MLPVVSVVIPGFGQPALLLDAIASAQAQTFRDLEIVVVDDGSDPPLREALAPVLHSIRYERQANAGPGAARNRGVQLARGELVAFLDSDDLWAPMKLDKQVAAMRASPDAGLCVTNEVLVDRDGRELKRGTRSLRPGLMRERIFAHQMINTSSVVVRRSVVADPRYRFWEERRYCEDWNLWMRMAFSVPVAVVDEPLASYRKAETGRATNQGDRMRGDGAHAVADALARLRAEGVDDATLARCERSARHLLCYHHFSFVVAQGRRRDALRDYATLARRPFSVEFAKATAKLATFPRWSRTAGQPSA